MSVKIMSLVWERAPYTAGSLLVLLALADWSNDEGICWPSIPTIAGKTRLEKRSIQYIIRQLKKDDLLDIEEGRGRGHQHRYTIKVQNLRLLPNLLKGANGDIKGEIHDTEKVQSATQKVKSTTEKVQPIAPDPLVDPLVEPSIEPKRDFLLDLRSDPLFSHVDFDYQLGLMQRWLARPENKGRRLTERFVLNWLNKIDRPVQISIHGSGSNGTDRAVREAELKKRMGWDKLERQSA